MKLLLLFGIWIGSVTCLQFQGCFREIPLAEGISRDFGDFNLNADCASFCASQGFALAATHGSECHCTNTVPLKRHMVSNSTSQKLLDGTDRSQCDTACPGSLVEGRGECMGDECCGGLYRRRHKRYSLYAVGGIDPVLVYITRIYQSLLKRDHQWLDVDYDAKDFTCDRKFHQVDIGHGYLQFDNNLHSIADYDVIQRVDSVDDCQDSCLRNSRCQSITFVPQARECYVNYMSSLSGHMTLADKESYVYDRNCTGMVTVLPTSFQLDVVKQTVSDTFDLGGTIEAEVDSSDMEIDLTDSPSWETTRRAVTVHTSQDYSISTHSGFVTSKSRTTSQDTSTSSSSTSSSQSSSTFGTSGGFGFSVGASASFGFFGFGGSVETEATSNFDFSDSTTKGQSSSTTTSQEQSRSSSKTESKTQMYNQDYTKTASTGGRQFYEYTMTVPAAHKGHLGFFVRKQPLTRKVVTFFQLNGYLKLKVRGEEGEREVHVSRVLAPQERYMPVLTQQVFQRQILLAKITITDSEGNKVTEESQIVERPN